MYVYCNRLYFLFLCIHIQTVRSHGASDLEMEAFDRETERVISGCLSASSCTLYIFARLLHNYMLILGATGECVCVWL